MPGRRKHHQNHGRFTATFGGRVNDAANRAFKNGFQRLAVVHDIGDALAEARNFARISSSVR